MSTYRVTRLAASGVAATGSASFRVTHLAVAADALTVSADGPARAWPGDLVTLSAVASDGNGSGVTFRQTTGPTVPLTQASGTATFTAPALAATGVVLTFTATLTRPGQADATATATVALIPASEYLLTPAGAWVPFIDRLITDDGSNPSSAGLGRAPLGVSPLGA